MNRWERVEALFHQVVDLPPGRRAAYLSEATGGDEALAGEVLVLAAAHDSEHRLLDSPRAAQLPAGTRIGPYRLESVLGAGGMGTVYAACRADQQFEKKVAVKLVNAGLAETIAGGRFERERRILASLEHPGIARLLDAGLNEYGQPYLVMERVDGQPLDAWLRARHPPLPSRLELFLQVASAVSYAHRNLVIHRDLKPSNILVTPEGIPKLLDFGIARLLNGESEATQTLRFSPLYASPEQVLGQATGTAVDIYALGVILYQLATGSHPFPDLARHPLAERRLAFAKGFPADLAAIITKALHIEPERRYSSVEQFSADVERFRAGRAVLAQPDSLLYRTRKFIQRHRLGTAAAALAALAAVVGIALVVHQSRLAERERQRAEAVSNFLLEIIRNANPERQGAFQGRPADLRLIDLLDASADRVGHEFQKEPDVEVRLRDELASAYQAIQQFAKSTEQANLALATARRAFGEESAQVALCYYRLGRTAVAESRFAEGERLLRLALERGQRAGADPRVLLTARGSLAAAVSGQGRAREALALNTEIFDYVKKHFGEDSGETGIAANQVAFAYYSLNDRAKFREWIERSVAIFRRRPRPPIQLGTALNNLAQVAFQERDYPKAIATIDEAVAFWRRQYGGLPHVDLATGLANAAIMRTTAGRAGGVPLAEEALRIYSQLQGPGSVEVAHGLYALGMSQCATGALQAGVARLESSLEIRRRKLPANDGRIASSAYQAGLCQLRRNRPAEAASHLRAAVAMRRARFGENDPLLRDMTAALEQARAAR